MLSRRVGAAWRGNPSVAACIIAWVGRVVLQSRDLFAVSEGASRGLMVGVGVETAAWGAWWVREGAYSLVLRSLRVVRDGFGGGDQEEVVGCIHLVPCHSVGAR